MSGVLELSEFFLESKTDDPVTEYPIHFPIVDGDTLSYDDFVRKFMSRNLPCLIKRDISKWQSRLDWANEDKPNLDIMCREVPGQLKVPVSHCSKRYFNSQQTSEMTFSQYMNYWRTSEKEELLYLKDWHFQRDVPSYKAYETPDFFSSDWLNEFWIENIKSDDYRFVYIGPKDSWTPFHTDVYGSFSWSANIAGRKKWLLLPPDQEKMLKDNRGQLPYDIEDHIDKRK